jgi:hypothetical protein
MEQELNKCHRNAQLNTSNAIRNKIWFNFLNLIYYDTCKIQSNGTHNWLQSFQNA